MLVHEEDKTNFMWWTVHLVTNLPKWQLALNLDSVVDEMALSFHLSTAWKKKRNRKQSLHLDAAESFIC